MTEKEYKEKHREMWGRIVEEYKNGNLEDICTLKMKILREMGYDSIRHDCFACEFSEGNCDKCPIVKKCGYCENSLSVWNKLLFFSRIKDGEMAVRRAKTIRDAWR